MTRAALTGGIGSGKSSVATELRRHGALVIDADQIARDIVAPGEPALAEIVAEFGPGILHADGTLDRAALAGTVFGDEERLGALNRIMHPRIGERAAAMLADAPAGTVAVYDMPLLVENGLEAGWDHIIVVEAPRQARIDRLVRDRGMSRSDVEARMAAQVTDEERRAVADTVIVNDGSLADLRREVDALWEVLAAGATSVSGAGPEAESR